MFMDWHGPIITDSGGFQVFSLAKIRKILPEGVRFQSHIDGKQFLLTPQKALEIQGVIGSDIRMILDVCPPYPCSRAEAEQAVERTTEWATLSLRAKRSNLINAPRLDVKIAEPVPSEAWGSSPKATPRNDKPMLFAIVQGSVHKDLRIKSARELVNLDFDGYAIGGLAVGEPSQKMFSVLSYTIPELPATKPRYLMGVGKPEQIVAAVKAGIDMFDCVIPTREARHGRLYFWKGAGFAYEAVSITNARFTKSFVPINAASRVKELQTYSRAYLHHLFKTEEPLGMRLATLNNVDFYLELMRRIRAGISAGRL